MLPPELADRWQVGSWSVAFGNGTAKAINIVQIGAFPCRSTRRSNAPGH